MHRRAPTQEGKASSVPVITFYMILRLLSFMPDIDTQVRKRIGYVSQFWSLVSLSRWLTSVWLANAGGSGGGEARVQGARLPAGRRLRVLCDVQCLYHHRHGMIDIVHMSCTCISIPRPFSSLQRQCSSCMSQCWQRPVMVLQTVGNPAAVPAHAPCTQLMYSRRESLPVYRYRATAAAAAM